MTTILTSSPREDRFCAALRTLAVAHIAALGEDDAAKKLGLYPRGVWALMRQEEWDLETAFRVVDALGFDVANQLESVAHDGRRRGLMTGAELRRLLAESEDPREPVSPADCRRLAAQCDDHYLYDSYWGGGRYWAGDSCYGGPRWSVQTEGIYHAQLHVTATEAVVTIEVRTHPPQRLVLHFASASAANGWLDGWLRTAECHRSPRELWEATQHLCPAQLVTGGA